MFEKIAFIHYPTLNLERALEFYRDVLGFKLLLQNKEWIEFDVGGQRLALRRVGSQPPHPQGGNHTGAMIWLETRPIEKAITQLRSKKVLFINELKLFSYGKIATFQDPDGNAIGLYEPPPE